MLHAVKEKFVRFPPNVAYYMHLDNPKQVRALRYRFKNTPLIYGISCQVTQMIYIGSTTVPGLRFHNHLVSRESSNEYLQAAITRYGLGKFTVHIFELVDLSQIPVYDQDDYLHGVEQKYINMFPKRQRYNKINSNIRY